MRFRGSWRSGRRALPWVFVALGSVLASGASFSAPPRPVSTERDLVELGRRLFFDPAATHLGVVACAACHDAEHGFSAKVRRSQDELEVTPRHSQPVVDLDVRSPMHWDGALASLRATIDARVFGVEEEGPRGKREVERYGGRPVVVRVLAAAPEDADEDLRAAPAQRVLRDPGVVGFPTAAHEAAAVGPRLEASRRYDEAFERLRGRAPQGAAVVGDALAAYIGSLRSAPAPVDRVLAGEALVLSAEAERGWALFRGRAGCANCHLPELVAGRASLRDGMFHNTGVSWKAAERDRELLSRRLDELAGSPPRVALQTVQGAAGGVAAERAREAAFAVVAEAKRELRSLLGDRGLERLADPGKDVRTFKTPSLRDVARRPPYMHDGSLATLADVVRHYATGCGLDRERDRRLKPFAVSEQDVLDLVAFLESCSGVERPGLADQPWDLRAPETFVTVVDAEQRPLPNVEVLCEPVGDLAGRDLAGRDLALAGPVRLRTSEAGVVRLAPSPRTHWRLSLPGAPPAQHGGLVCDTCRSARLCFPVRGWVRILLDTTTEIAIPSELQAFQQLDAGQALNRLSSRSRSPQVDRVRQAARGGAPSPFVWNEAWTFRVVRRVESMPVGAPPGEPADLLVVYEGYRPGFGSTEVFARVPGRRGVLRLDLRGDEMQVPAGF